MKDKIVLGSIEFETLVAITEDEHLSGLMFKAWPPPVMSFPFETTEPRKFWMNNTISPLDILFCRANKIIAIFEGEPLSKKLIGPDEPVDLVVELPKGTASKNNITVGDGVKLKYSLYTISKKIAKKIASRRS
jgi:uncharacterized membrane protein (UPF0127 family)